MYLPGGSHAMMKSSFSFIRSFRHFWTLAYSLVPGLKLPSARSIVTSTKANEDSINNQ